MVPALTARGDLHVADRPVRVPELVDFDLLTEFVLVDLVNLQGPGRGQGRVSWDAAPQFVALQFPVARVAVLQHIGEIDEVERIVHGAAPLNSCSDGGWGMS